MSKGGIDRLIEQVQDVIGASMRASHERALSRFDSPIETLFYSAITAALRNNASCPECETIKPILDKQKWQEEFVENLGLAIEKQVVVLDWPVDFLAIVKDFEENYYYAVIECDGHDYHERTKEQAQRDRSRDRRLQEAGFRVFRFTGSELYRDPYGCAMEVMRWADLQWGKGLPI